MGRNLLVTTMTLTMVMVACQKKSEDASATAAPKTLYVSTGACNSGGGVTTYLAATATKTIERFGSDNGAHKGTLIDYTVSNFLASTTPQNMIDKGSELWVLNENAVVAAAAERRVIRIPKADPLNYKVHYANLTSMNGIMRGLASDVDGSMLIGKTTAVEKINSVPVRVIANTFPWVNNPQSTCTGSNVAISGVTLLPPLTALGAGAGKIIMAHQGTTTAANKLNVIRESGYFGNTDCVMGTTIASISHTLATNLVAKTVAFNAVVGTSPTSMVYIDTPGGATTGKLLVTYSNNQQSNTTAAGAYNVNHAIVAIDVNDTALGTTTLGPATILWDDYSIVYGASAMAYDASTNSLYVAVGGEPGVAPAAYAANSVGYNIEKFTLDTTNWTLSRVAPNNQAFIRGNENTKCISDMKLGE